MEKELEIKKTSSKGKDYSNIDLRQLSNNEFVILEKEGFLDGMPITAKSAGGKTYSFFSCKAKYKDTLVGFSLYNADHEAWRNAGGLGDKIKVNARVDIYKDKNNKDAIKRWYEFSLLE